jgi:GH24 family phage-related lysozyme (muramidase)
METFRADLKKGDSGSDVKQVQTALIQWGYRVPADGRFGPGTQAAVRSFQTHELLLPTGIVDRQTFRVLNGERGQSGDAPRTRGLAFLALLASVNPEVLLTAIAARSRPVLAGHSKPANILRLSAKGCQFIYEREALKGTSEHLHHPPGASGVTLGPGYDMKERSEAEIIADLTAIGVAIEEAKKAAKGRGLREDKAETFADDCEDLITLTEAQQMQLLKRVTPEYERIVRRHITIDLFQWEYDALVCFVYNPGGSFLPVARHINAGKIEDALRIIKSRTGSGGSVIAGLANRRKLEIALYLYGDYHAI